MTINQYNIDKVDNIVWYIKGMVAQSKNDLSSDCPFNDDHLYAIKEAILLMKQELNYSKTIVDIKDNKDD